jgi:endonuclease III
MDNNVMKIKRLLKWFPLYSEDLSIDLSIPSGRFRWFLASVLFGARISEQIAANTYRCFEAAGIVDAPDRIIEAGWDRLVEILDAGGYVRYDFSTATKLLEIMTVLEQNYGSLENLYRHASDGKDLEKRLQGFKGIGPTTTQVFLRELRGIWQVQPKIAEIACMSAANLNMRLNRYEGKMLARTETALVKLYLRYCKRRKCRQCPMADSCTKMIGQPQAQ